MACRRKSIPFWVLLVSFAPLKERLTAELQQAVVQLPTGPIELWIGAVAETERGEAKGVEAARTQTNTAKLPPEELGIRG